MKHLPISLVLCHGWGFSPRYWDALLTQLPSSISPILWNLGYDGTSPSFPTPPDASLKLALGHSLGFATLIQRHHEFDAIIGLNGFRVFCQKPNFLYGHPEEEVLALKHHLQKAPERTLHHFYKRCGAAAELFPLTPTGLERLISDLDLLCTLDVRSPYSCPAFFGHTTNDPIVPLVLLEQSCAEMDHSFISLYQGDHHVLGQREIPFVLDLIELARNQLYEGQNLRRFQ